MNFRRLGKTGFLTSEIGFGAWAIGNDAWGAVDDRISKAALHKFVELAGNFIDTANVYGSGHSEQIIGELFKDNKKIFIATKAGRAPSPHSEKNYTYEALSSSVEESLKRLQTDSLDLLQLHCPPPQTIKEGKVFDYLRKLRHEGKIKNFGVSVETVEEALDSIKDPDVATIQIIFNIFRSKPAEVFFEEAKKRDVGVIVRVPLASGLLSGKITPETSFSENDHRLFNRNGEAFDRGETFSGVPLDSGFPAVEELKTLLPKDQSLAQFSLRWILDHEAVSVVIPGLKTPEQTVENIRSASLPPLAKEQKDRVAQIYDKYIRAHVHHLW